jgi:hypothetical protein
MRGKPYGRRVINMPSRARSGNASSGAAGPSQKIRVLLMSGDGMETATRWELSRLPGCSVQTCSNYVELLLRLEHEAFQLVIIFEGENSPPGWQEAVKQTAQANNGTPVVVIKQPREAGRFPEALAS